MKYMQPKTFNQEVSEFFEQYKGHFNHGSNSQLNALRLSITTDAALTLTDKGHVDLTALQDKLLDEITFYENYNPIVNDVLVPFETQMCEQHLSEFTQEEDIDGQVF